MAWPLQCSQGRLALAAIMSLFLQHETLLSAQKQLCRLVPVQGIQQQQQLTVNTHSLQQSWMNECLVFLCHRLLLQ